MRKARAGQILISLRAFAALEARVAADCVSELTPQGFLRPVTTYGIRALKAAAASP